MPELVPTVAIGVELLLHVPPVVASARVIVAPVHTLTGLGIYAGFGFTVTVLYAEQPVVAMV